MPPGKGRRDQRCSEARSTTDNTAMGLNQGHLFFDVHILTDFTKSYSLKRIWIEIEKRKGFGPSSLLYTDTSTSKHGISQNSQKENQ